MKLRNTIFRALLLGLPLVLATQGFTSLVNVTQAAGAQPQLRSYVHRPIVGVGDFVLYTVDVTLNGDGNSLTNAFAGKTDGFESLSTSHSSRSSFVMGGGAVQQSTTISVTFRLRAQRIGKFTLGPAKLVIDGQSVLAPTTTITVVEQGKAPPPPRQPATDPFDDFFGQSHPFAPPNGQSAPEPEEQHPTPITPDDSSAALSEVPKGTKNAFVRVVVEPADRVVVGQPLTAKLIIYAKRMPRPMVQRPPVFADFVSVELGQLDREWHKLTIGKDVWAYVVIAGYKIHPLKQGKLSIGPTEVLLQSTDLFGLTAGTNQEIRSAETIVEVSQPPLQGRPSDYVVGDVASELELKAELSPKQVSDGHALLILRMKGRGRIETLKPIFPANKSVSFTMTADEAQNQIDGVHLKVSRKITYDVSFTQTGNIDLGEVLAHVWDQTKEQYVTAKAKLGTIQVQKLAPQPAASTSVSTSTFTLPPSRQGIGSEGSGKTLADHSITWFFLGSMPLMAFAAQSVLSVFKKTRKARAVLADSPIELAKQALDEARKYEQSGLKKETASALIKALDRSMEAMFQLKSRSLTSSELHDGLCAAGVSKAMALEVTQRLDSLDAVRFAGGDIPSTESVASLIQSLRQLSKN